MWVHEKPNWVRTVILGGAALPSIWRRTLFVFLLSGIVTYGYHHVPHLDFSVTPTPFVMLGLPLGIFLGFRNNGAYDRFWEGRRLWGQLVNTSRTFTRQVLTMIQPAVGEGEGVAKAREVELVHHLIAYVHAFRHHLRDEDPSPMLARILPGFDHVGEPNVPAAIQMQMGSRLAAATRAGCIHPFHFAMLEQTLTVLTDVQGGCERIKSTPLPYSYAVLMHRIVAGYCVLLPFGIAEASGWATPFVSLAISYALFGLDAVGDEIEEPFGTDPNDLPLYSLSIMIEGNARARIGEPIPPKVQAVNGLLP